MNIDRLKEYEPFFGGYFVCNEINSDENLTEFRVKKESPDSHKTEYATLKCYFFPCRDALSSGAVYPAKLRRMISDTEKMLKLQNCRSIVKFYSSSVLTTDDGFELLILAQNLFPLPQVADISSLSRDEVYSVISSVCDALSSFRSLGIYHGKICPENIFVDSEGKYYLGDFGLGSTYTPDSDFITPEEYHVSSDLSSVDIYRTGMLFYKLLNNNRAPFLPLYPTEISPENKENAFMRRISGEKLNITNNILDSEAKIILKACAFSAYERYRNVASLKSDIDSLMGILVSPKADELEEALFERSPRVIAIEPEDEPEDAYSRTDIYVEDLSENDSSESKSLINILIAAIAVVAVIASSLVAWAVVRSRRNNTAPVTEDTSFLSTAQTEPPSSTEYTSPAASSSSEATTTLPPSTEATAYTSAESTATQYTTTEEPTVTTTEGKKPFTLPQAVLVKINPKRADVSVFSDGERVDEVVVSVEASFGAYVASVSDAVIYEYNSGNILQSRKVDTSCMYDSSDKTKLICDVHIPEDFIMDFENCNYVLTFEKGSIRGFGYLNDEFSVDIYPPES